MALKFRNDEDLSVLALSSHEDLEKLALVLTHDGSDQKQRHAAELLDDLSYQTAVEKKDLRLAWKSIAAELQAFGGDSIANTWRSLTQGHTGVAYREIVTDICEHLKLKRQPAKDIMELEDQLLVGLILSQKDKFSAEELTRIMEEAAKGMRLDDNLQKDWKLEDLAQRVASDARFSYIAALAAPAIASAAIPFLARLSLPAVLAVIAPRVGGALVPGLGAVAAASSLTLLTSPALRVTLPAVLEVIRIRRLALLSPMSAGDTA